MNPTLTNAGRAALAASIAAVPLFLAWGTGAATWDTSRTVTGTGTSLFPANSYSTGFTGIDTVVVTNTDAHTNYSGSTDYTVNGATGVITLPVGTTIVGGSNLSISYHIATPLPDVSATGLIAEVGRHICLSKLFVNPDGAGSIVVSTGTFSLSASNGTTPTRYLYLNTSFEPDNSPSALIREIGAFLGTVVQTGLPTGQLYFTPGQITTPGTLLIADRIPLITRTATSRETFRCVVQF